MRLREFITDKFDPKICVATVDLDKVFAVESHPHAFGLGPTAILVLENGKELRVDQSYYEVVEIWKGLA